jgi:glycosyltransferase involved in cell wall biosynthesis
VRIGVDAACWANGRGYGRFTRELLRAMVAEAPACEWICFADELAADTFDLEAPNLSLVTVAQRESPTRAAAADGHRSPADMLRFTRAVWQARLDVFFSPSVYTFFPLPPGLPAVVAIHDAIPERFPELTLPSRRARLFWSGKVRLALAQARLILTVSRYAASELQQVLGVAASRIRIAQPAPSPVYAPVSHEEAVRTAAELGVPVGQPWFTYVGGFNPHKRVDTLVEAHAHVVREGRYRPHLVLVGSLSEDVFHGNLAEIRAAIALAGTEELVHWPGFVPDEKLRALHSGATALVLVSESEGFGLPAIEAAACGTPVIATIASPLPELLPGGGLFVKPGEVERIGHSMRKLLSDPDARTAMGELARRAAQALEWQSGARAALSALHEAAGHAARTLAAAGSP